ncbi:Hypothetical protein FKW44_022110 [Caligus rogercresseyi]|uniref:Uncharacterized protein n=1 Tax=Caligus rogercresseyi TaxID=217165 RepID=A0A7T8GSB3_CALRO|nr:Hypothetical protein FKW44_022110 [Caligus rogercresseyi]
MNNGDTSFKDKKRPGRPKTTRTLAKIEESKALIAQYPSTSIRRLSREMRCQKNHERALEGGLGSEKLGQDEGADVNLSST